MDTLFLILSVICFGASLALIFVRGMLAPVAAFLGLLFMWFSNKLPLNSTIIIMWLCMTALVTCVPMLQDPYTRNRRDGIAYITAGAFTGMVVGLLGITFATTPAMLYGIMVVATAVGTFFGYILYTNTPKGKQRNGAEGRSFNYLLAKGFPIAITVMEIGVVFVLLLLMNQTAILAH